MQSAAAPPSFDDLAGEIEVAIRSGGRELQSALARRLADTLLAR